MPRVDVVPTEKDKFKVLVNYIQRGIDYSSEIIANAEATKLRKEIENTYSKR